VESTSRPQTAPSLATAPAQVDVRFSEAVELKSARLAGPRRWPRVQVPDARSHAAGRPSDAFADGTDHRIVGGRLRRWSRRVRSRRVHRWTGASHRTRPKSDVVPAAVPVTLTGSRPGQLSVRLLCPEPGGRAHGRTPALTVRSHGASHPTARPRLAGSPSRARSVDLHRHGHQEGGGRRSSRAQPANT
jgi:hypothetical protein